MINKFSSLLHWRINNKNGILKAKIFLNGDCTDHKMLSGSKTVWQQRSRGDRHAKTERQMPTLVYVQNPITWLINKVDFKMLKNAWDPEFDEKEFRRGTIHAVSVICTLISKNMWDSLKGLLTRQALSRLQKEVELTWSDVQRRNIYVEPADVKLALPRKVHFLRIADKKFVDVDMMFVIMKFKELEPSLNNELLFIELVARFHRNYTSGEIPNWTITLFKVTRFNGAHSSK